VTPVAPVQPPKPEEPRISTDEVINKLAAGAKEFKERWQTEESRANMLESKLKTLVEAVKEERELKKQVIPIFSIYSTSRN
jgi:hypothetical protein